MGPYILPKQSGKNFNVSKDISASSQSSIDLYQAALTDKINNSKMKNVKIHRNYSASMMKEGELPRL